MACARAAQGGAPLLGVDLAASHPDGRAGDWGRRPTQEEADKCVIEGVSVTAQLDRTTRRRTLSSLALALVLPIPLANK